MRQNNEKKKVFSHNFKNYVWRKVNVWCDEKHTIPAMKLEGGSLTFQGFVSYTGNLVKTDGKINGECYPKILEDNLHSSAWKLRIGRIWVFQHDSDPKQKAKSTFHWLQKKKVLKWPSQSPDLNVIEPL